ncbi:MAG: peroxidase family protein [Thiolinea sp.]
MDHNLLKNRPFYSKYIALSLLAGGIVLSGLSGQVFAQCPVEQVYLPVGQPDEYRKMNGRKNNLSKRGWGAAKQKLLRVVGTDSSREPANNALPGPREISNIVSSQGANETTRNAKGLSDMFWLWGQFLDHDITLVHTDESQPANIAIPSGDPAFSGLSSLPFSRSELTGNGRNHPNVLTSYIDGSNIYGSDTETANSLRSFQGGKLIMENGLMPKDSNGFFRAGDERANEHFGLTAMHTLWVREHNRVADALACEYSWWSDEQIFLEARRIVVAQLQAITYNEFLPAMLGPYAMPGYWEDIFGYDDTVRANISNIFAVSAYRFGHSMLSPNLLRLTESGEEIAQGHVALKDAFFRPAKLEEAGLEPVLRGFASQMAQALDPMVVDDVRNFLILGPGESQGFDLAALNIQRGRDHKLPGYNDVREALGLRRINDFYDGIWRESFRDRLASAYNHPDDVDLWVGSLAEEEVNNSLVGETLRTIFIEQFRRLRHGDRFWYENEDTYYYYDIQEFNKIRLADIIKRNTSVNNIQSNVFIATEIHDPVEVQAAPAIVPFAAPAAAPEFMDENRREEILDAISEGLLG